MNRLNRFNSYASHPWLSREFDRLSEQDLETCRVFIQEHDALSKDAFATAVNRWLLDQPKPKRFSSMWALVLQCNSA